MVLDRIIPIYDFWILLFPTTSRNKCMYINVYEAINILC